MGPTQNRLLRAMAGALHHAEVYGPRADVLSSLMRHHTRELMEVREIVRGPRGKELTERDGTERRVPASTRKMVVSDVQRAKLIETRAPREHELIQQIVERPSTADRKSTRLNSSHVSESR